jgi:hypothetical protein
MGLFGGAIRDVNGGERTLRERSLAIQCLIDASLNVHLDAHLIAR